MLQPPVLDFCFIVSGSALGRAALLRVVVDFGCFGFDYNEVSFDVGLMGANDCLVFKDCLFVFLDDLLIVLCFSFMNAFELRILLLQFRYCVIFG